LPVSLMFKMKVRHRRQPGSIWEALGRGATVGGNTGQPSNQQHRTAK